jgi:hypothetical protein
MTNRKRTVPARKSIGADQDLARPESMNAVRAVNWSCRSADADGVARRPCCWQCLAARQTGRASKAQHFARVVVLAMDTENARYATRETTLLLLMGGKDR